MNYLKAFLTVSLCVTAFVGDYVVNKSRYADSFVFRAIADNFVHTSIGCLSAMIFFCREVNISSPACITNVALCTLVSSLIDIDHFMVARSIYLKDLVGLHQRGLFHCTTLWLAVTMLLLIYSYIYKKANINLMTWMLIIAYTSHHIRDANRRGLWMYPFGSTKAFNTYVYVLLICILPHIYSYLYLNYKTALLKYTVVEYRMLV